MFLYIFFSDYFALFDYLSSTMKTFGQHLFKYFFYPILSLLLIKTKKMHFLNISTMVRGSSFLNTFYPFCFSVL